MLYSYEGGTCITVKVRLNKVTNVTQPLMTAVSNDGRFFLLKLFHRFNGNGNNSILVKGGLT